MIKYFQYDSIDDYGKHISPINTTNDITKLASNSYSQNLMEIIDNLNKNPEFYYVVINALGSYEMWGGNNNGDAFPIKGLAHKSLRSDMSTLNDYGYKTFEYYAKLYKHHVNKDPKKSFGHVEFSHWNPKIHRVELITAVDKRKGEDIIEAVENDDLVSVSMGAKLRYDRCNICGNKAKTRKEYCKHLRSYLGKMVTEELADKWSKELGKQIVPGTVVLAMNDYPRFFDISKVYVGADRTSFVLGKAASDGIVISSIDMAEIYDVNENDIDKLAFLGKHGNLSKKSELRKKIDGNIISTKKEDVIRKMIDDTVMNSIKKEPELNKKTLDSISSFPLEDLFETMLKMGIHPKPQEFQRIILVHSGANDLADYLDNNKIIFDKDNYNKATEIKDGKFDNLISKLLSGVLQDRSSLPYFIEDRMNNLSKTSSDLSMMQERSKPSLGMKSILIGLAGLYAGLKMKAKKMNPSAMMDAANKPWIVSLITGGVGYKLLTNKDNQIKKMLQPAYKYEDSLSNTYFSGHTKLSSIGGSAALGALTGLALYPSSHIINSYNQKSLYNKGKELFPGAGSSPKSMALKGGAAVAGTHYLSSKAFDKIKKGVSKLLK